MTDQPSNGIKVFQRSYRPDLAPWDPRQPRITEKPLRERIDALGLKMRAFCEAMDIDERTLRKLLRGQELAPWRKRVFDRQLRELEAEVKNATRRKGDYVHRGDPAAADARIDQEINELAISKYAEPNRFRLPDGTWIDMAQVLELPMGAHYFADVPGPAYQLRVRTTSWWYNDRRLAEWRTLDTFEPCREQHWPGQRSFTPAAAPQEAGEVIENDRPFFTDDIIKRVDKAD